MPEVQKIPVDTRTVEFKFEFIEFLHFNIIFINFQLPVQDKNPTTLALGVFKLHEVELSLINNTGFTPRINKEILCSW